MKNKDKAELMELISQSIEPMVRKVVRETMEEVLMARLKWEQVRDPDTGQPLAVPKIIDEDVFLPSFIAQMILFNEGAMRGMQETTDRVKNRMASMEKEVSEYNEKLSIVGKCLSGMEEAVMILGKFSRKVLKTFPEMKEETIYLNESGS